MKQPNINTPMAKIAELTAKNDYAGAAAWAQLLADTLRAMAAVQPVDLPKIREAGL